MSVWNEIITDKDLTDLLELYNGFHDCCLKELRYISAKRNSDGSWSATVTITDTFDFTQFKNPFKQGTVLKGLLWAANDIAYYDTEWGLLDPVEVKIIYDKVY